MDAWFRAAFSGATEDEKPSSVATEPLVAPDVEKAFTAPPVPARSDDGVRSGGDTKQHGAMEQKQRGELEEESVPGQEDEGRPTTAGRGGGGRFATARAGASGSTPGFMTSKGRLSTRYTMMSARDAALEEVEKEEEKTKRLAARKGARKTHRMAALHPLVTSRPKPQRWVKRADDWKREAEQACLEAHHVWGEVPKEAQKIAAAGLPPRPYAQVKSKVQGGALSEQERAYQLESLLANRERKRLAAVKARVKEARANEQYDENRRRLEWYHTQREKAATPMRPDERKVAQERLAALPDRPVKGAVYG